MNDLPAPIRDFIYTLTEDTRSPAYLSVNETDALSDWGGDLESYGITGLRKDIGVGEQLSFLAGVLPLDTSGVFLPNVQTKADVFADIYVFRRNQRVWVLFLDASAAAAMRQRMQQKTYDISLHAADLEREGESLGAANTLLGRRVKEQTEELSLTVLRLQQELAEGRRTEQKLRESEARFRAVYDSAMIGIMFCDVRGHITGANDVFLQLLGYSRDDLANGTIAWSQITAPSAPDFKDKLTELSETLVYGPLERQFIRKDGSPVTLLFGTGPLEGQPDKLAGFVIDLSKIKRSHQATP